MTQTFKVGDKVRFFQDLSKPGDDPVGVPLYSVGDIYMVDGEARNGSLPHILVKFDEVVSIWFHEAELQLVDEEVDLPFNPLNGVTLNTVLDTSLEANQNLYLSALSGMATARKQMADLTLDRYLPTAVREALEEALEKKVADYGQQAEDSVKRMAKILEVGL